MPLDEGLLACCYDVSVIVPIYRTERYLDECVKSLLAQTLGKRLQIVLVDDGSPDRCGEIADGYAERYENVICVHREIGRASCRERV